MRSLAPTPQRAHEPAVPKAHAPRAAPTSHGDAGLPLFLQAAPATGVVQRACACGASASGECEECNHPPGLQAKLTIGASNDPLEQEADQVAEQVMRMPDPALQRQTDAAENAGELHARPLVQRKSFAAQDGGAEPPAAVHEVLRSPGEPLGAAERQYFEPRFGHDFSQVRVHTDALAGESAREVNARAYTVGGNIAFAEGQYSPGTDEGKRLLAHELTHVVQQGSGDSIRFNAESRNCGLSPNTHSRIQRKIIVGGKPYIPTAKYYEYLGANFGAHMQEFVKNMHNDGKPPDFTFTSHEQMGYEVRVRHQITKGMDEAHGGSCNYPDSANPDRLDSTYWDRKGYMHFTPKSPLPAGKEASDAIEAIFAPGADSRLECMAMTVAVEYYSLLKGLGKEKFNVLFPGGAGLEISTRLAGSAHPTFYGAKKLYKNMTLTSKSEILTGDWLYFKNFKDYLVKHPGGFWQGENAIYMGGGNYRGFGVSSMKEADLNAELVKQYNTGLPVADRKTVADLLAEGGGLMLNPVARPDIAKLAP
jgi:hypothetical protein